MPAESKRQLKKAYAACRRGEKWGCDMVEHTPRKKRSSLMRGGTKRKRAKKG